MIFSVIFIPLICDGTVKENICFLGETNSVPQALDNIVAKHVDYLIHSPLKPGRVAQSVGHLTRKSGVLGSIPGLATYFRFSFRFFKKGSCQLLAKVCARSTG